MRSLHSPYTLVPAVLLLLVGVGLAVHGGVSWHTLEQEAYEYEAVTEDVYEFSALSANEREAVVAAVNGTEYTTSGTLDRLHDPGERLTSALVSYNGSYHMVEASPDDSGNMSVTTRAQYDRDVVYEYSSLSEAGQKAVEKTATNPGETVRLVGAVPPEFETGGDAADIGYGYYFVTYDGESYSLSVQDTGPEGLTADLLSLWYRFVGLAGLFFVAVGAYSVRREYIRPPTVALVSLGVFVGLSVVVGLHPLVAGVASVAAALGTWNLLYWYDIGADETGPSSANEL